MRLKRHYSIIAHSADVVELRHGTWNPLSLTFTDETRSGRLFRVMMRLDGRSTLAEIAAAEGISRPDLEVLVAQLAEMGVMEEGPSHALDYYLDLVIPNLVPYKDSARARASSIILLGDDDLCEQIARVLRASELQEHYEVEIAGGSIAQALSEVRSSSLFDGLAFEEDAQAFAGWGDRFVIFASSTVNPLELQAFNRICLRHRISWIQAAMDGPFLLVGPTFVPLRTACYECLEMRVLMNLREGASYQKYKRALLEGRTSRAVMPLDAVLGAMLASLTAFEALNFVLTGAAFTKGKMLSVYLPTMEFTFNDVLRLPGCPACSPAPERDGRELAFDLRSLLGPTI